MSNRTIIKRAEATDFSWESEKIVLADEAIHENFVKTARELKKVAPKADDFLYFSCVMMHAAEASAINPDGTPKLDKQGKEVKVGWKKNAKGGMKWETTDPSVQAYRNSNRDIFPESELLLAYKNWIGKPLCVDHRSSEIEAVRGFIADAYYDHKLKRVVALCALDKLTYPDLAHKVSSGYTSDVSMGTAVGCAICYDCGHPAMTESQYCNHMRSRTCYGEINTMLNPIELSIVVNGADQQAKIKHVIASEHENVDNAKAALENYLATKVSYAAKKEASQRYIASLSIGDSDGTDSSGKAINFETENFDEFTSLVDKAIKELSSSEVVGGKKIENATVTKAFEELADYFGSDADESKACDSNTCEYSQSSKEEATVPVGRESTSFPSVPSRSLASLADIFEKLAGIMKKVDNTKDLSGDKMTQKSAFMLGTTDPKEKAPQYDAIDQEAQEAAKHMITQDLGPTDSIPKKDLEIKEHLCRAQAENRAKRAAALELSKKSFMLGTTDPKEKVPQYDAIDQEAQEAAKHMTVKNLGPVNDIPPEDKAIKEKLLRANLTLRRVKNAGNIGASRWEIVSKETGKVVFAATIEQLTNGEELLYSAAMDNSYGLGLLNKFASGKVKTAQPAPEAAPTAPPPPPAVDAAPVAPEAPVAPASAIEGAVQGGEGGDPKAELLETAKKLRDLASEVNEKVVAVVGDQAEMGENLSGKTASFSGKAAFDSTASLVSSLRKEASEVVPACLSAADELEEFAQALGNTKSAAYGKVKEAAKEALADARAYGKRGVVAIHTCIRVADAHKLISKIAEVESLEEKPVADELAGEEHLMSEEDIAKLLSQDIDGEPALSGEEALNEELALLADDGDESAADANVLVPGSEVKLPSGQKLEVKAALETKAGRAALRAKFASEVVNYSDVFETSAPKNVTPTGGAEEAEGDLGQVENIEEQQEADIDVVPTDMNIRVQAANIDKLIKAGELTEDELRVLVRTGSVDAATEQYYRKYFGSSDSEGSEFARDLTKEIDIAKEAERNEQYRIKLSSAYALAYEMADGGLIARARTSIEGKVNELMKSSDENFDQIREVVAMHASTTAERYAGALPQAGAFSHVPVKTAAKQNGDIDMLTKLQNTIEARAKKARMGSFGS
jgi:hypothetical protein